MGSQRRERGWAVGLAWAAVVAGAGAFVCSPLLTCLFGWTPTLLLVGACLAALGVVICLALLLLRQRPRRIATGLFLGTAWLLLGGLVFFLFSLSLERPHRDPCCSNLKRIGYACMLYSEDHGNALPGRLGGLYPAYIADPAVFACPRAAMGLHPYSGEPIGRIPGEHRNYCYVSGLTEDDNPESILAFDEEWNHQGVGINVLRVGRSVQWHTDIEDVHRELDRQRARLAAEGREMKIIRPSWSRWPERPEYPVTFWYESRLAHVLLAAGALAAVVTPALFIRRRRRRARGAVSDT